MERNIKISCIIPIYNSERYLRETLQSLMKQTFSEIEIICINDASTDDSLKILEELSREDSRFIIVDNFENKGAAISRNIGLDRANGEYVIFLDSDDYFFDNMLEETYGLAKQYKSDVVIFGYEWNDINEEKQSLVFNNFQILTKGKRDEEYIRKIKRVAWNKLIRRDILKRYGIRFQNIATNNDVYFSFAVSLAADKVVICDKVLLRYYYGRDGSLTQLRQKKISCRVQAFAHILEFLNNVKIESSVKKELYNNMISSLESCFDNINVSLECKEYIERQVFENIFLNQELRKAYEEGMLYAHSQIFVEKVFRREEIKKCNFYEYYIPGIKRVLLKNKENEKKIAVWGCGKIGKRIIDGLNANELAVDYLIDMDPQKKNTSYGGYEINFYETVKDDVDIILVTISDYGYCREITEMAKNKEVLNIHTM